MSNQKSPAEGTLTEPAKNTKFIALFESSIHSDITVKVQENTWKLHRCYLAQSPYFEALFEGSWKESKQEVFEIVLPHEAVTVESLDAIFESMYTHRIDFSSSNVVSILATASFFLLQDQMEECYDFMIETMNQDSVMEFYQIASIYEGGEKLKDAAIEYMKIALTHDSFVKNLSKIDADLMTKLVKDPELCVMFNEATLYITLSMWLYTKVAGIQVLNYESDHKKMLNFFKRRVGRPFLSTLNGFPFIEAFKGIRLEHVITSTNWSVSDLYDDNIIPNDWITRSSLYPSANDIFDMEKVSKDIFLSNCLRWGCKIHNVTRSHNFHFGLLKFKFEVEFVATLKDFGWSIQIKRSFLTSDSLRHTPQKLMIQLKLIVVNETGQILRRKKTDILSISLKVDEAKEVMNVEKELQGENDYFFGINLMYDAQISLK